MEGSRERERERGDGIAHYSFSSLSPIFSCGEREALRVDVRFNGGRRRRRRHHDDDDEIHLPPKSVDGTATTLIKKNPATLSSSS